MYAYERDERNLTNERKWGGATQREENEWKGEGTTRHQVVGALKCVCVCVNEYECV